MDLSFFTLFCVIAVGAVISFLVWMSGLLIRKRLRGPGRMIIMTVLLVLWYVSLYPLMTSPDLEEGTRKAYQIGVHSIWIWWVWAMMRFLTRVKSEANKTGWKRSVYNATGIHRITAELRKTQERRRLERESEKPAEKDAPKPDFTPDI